MLIILETLNCLNLLERITLTSHWFILKGYKINFRDYWNYRDSSFIYIRYFLSSYDEYQQYTTSEKKKEYQQHTGNIKNHIVQITENK